MNELIVNLWAIFDADSGLVYALSGKVYCVSGDDEFKLGVLKALARTDHITAKRYEVPARFQVSFPDGSVKKKVTLLNAIVDPNSNLFEDMFSNLESELPPEMIIKNGDFLEGTQKLTSDPLCTITTLYEDEQGNITPVVTDSDREWVKEQEHLRGR